MTKLLWRLNVHEAVQRQKQYINDWVADYRILYINPFDSTLVLNSTLRDRMRPYDRWKCLEDRKLSVFDPLHWRTCSYLDTISTIENLYVTIWMDLKWRTYSIKVSIHHNKEVRLERPTREGFWDGAEYQRRHQSPSPRAEISYQRTRISQVSIKRPK